MSMKLRLSIVKAVGLEQCSLRDRDRYRQTLRIKDMLREALFHRGFFSK